MGSQHVAESSVFRSSNDTLQARQSPEVFSSPNAKMAKLQTLIGCSIALILLIAQRSDCRSPLIVPPPPPPPLPSQESIHRARACEHASADGIGLLCPIGQTIHILDGFYGRMTGNEVCPGNVSNQKCRGEGDLALIKEACQYKDFCSLTARNSVFGDPCYGTNKYLEVLWICA